MNGAFMRRLEWPVLAAATVTAIVLGIDGFSRPPHCDGCAPLDLLYRSLQLFVLESGALSPPVHWTLQVARFLAPAVAAYAAARAVAELLRDRLVDLRLRRQAGHVVVAGAGRRGTRLACEFRAMGLPVSVVDIDPSAPGLASCRAAGALVKIGDATDPSRLAEVGIARARTVVAACREEGTNAAVAAAVRTSIEGTPRERAIECFVHISDPALCALLREAELRAGRPDQVRTEFVDVFERAARGLVERMALSPLNGNAPHLALVGLGRLGEAVWLHAAREWWFERSDRQPLVVTIVDREARARAQACIDRHPGLAHTCDWEAVDADVRSPDADWIAALRGEGGRPAASLACVLFDDEPLALATALVLERETASLALPVFVRTADSSGLASLLTGPRLRPFPLLDETCTPRTLSAGMTELLATAFHRDHVRCMRAAGDPGGRDTSTAPWSVLPEEFRESSRRRARALSKGLAEIHCELRLQRDWARCDSDLPEEAVEILAAHEHARWMAERVADGWRYGAGPKNTGARTNPWLVPWAALDESVKKQNRDTIRTLPRFLSRAGLEIVPRQAVSVRTAATGG